MSKSSEKVIEVIEEYLAEGGLIWHKPYMAVAQTNAASRCEYKGINAFVTALVAGMRGYASPYWATFRQIRELGGTLKDAKGQGAPILFYKDLPDGKDGKKQFVIRHSFVFNFDLVEGVEIESLETAGDDFEKDSCAEAICRDYLERESVRLGDSAIPCYSPVTDTVKIPALESFVGQDEYYSTLFHELGHSTGHKSRLDRFEKTATLFESKEDYSKEELVAEITAALLCHTAGVDSEASIKNSAAYIAGWSKFIRDNSSSFVTAVNQAYKAKSLILNEA